MGKSHFLPRLHTAAMEFGSQRSSNLLKTKAVEQCFCPTGYEGLSCESCSYGYTRYDMNYINCKDVRI